MRSLEIGRKRRRPIVYILGSSAISVFLLVAFMKWRTFQLAKFLFRLFLGV